jgi:hypothetical protein
MLFSEMLRRLQQPDIDLDQVGKLTYGQDSTIMVGRPKEIVIPFQFQYHTFYAPADVQDFEITDEEVDALLRRFKITREQFDQPP